MLPNNGDVECMPAVMTDVLISGAPPPPATSDGGDTANGLSRSASFTYIPGLTETPPETGIKRTFSENDLAFPSSTPTKSNTAAVAANRQIFRKASRKVKKKLPAPKSSGSQDDGLTQKGTPNGSAVQLPEGSDRPKIPGRSMSGTIRSLARRSWISNSSRSPSPANKIAKKPEKGGGHSPTKSSAFTTEKPITPPLPAVSRASPRASRLMREDLPPGPDIEHSVRSTTPKSKDMVRPLSMTSSKTKSETSSRFSLSRTPSSLSLGSKSSSENINITMMKVPPMPASISSDRLSAASTEVRRKDPLWAAFRVLEGDFQKFQSKSSSLKANVVRASLLPFLSKYMDHPSNKFLRADDLDRRVVILNKWWIGLLEILNGNNNQAVSGTDRPVFLDAVTGVMLRPEWRTPFTSQTMLEPSPIHRPMIPKSRSTTSIESSNSDVLTDSIHQNVRNIFVQNLLSQMALVVDKMSLRSAPASLVSFCGKACAYAFFFCPGVADILVRLWRIPQRSLCRVFAELGASAGTDLNSVSKEVSSYFPPPLQGLSVTSRAALIRYLHHPAPLPLGAAYIRWYGPWINRWTGRESDLFFVFNKHFHMLVADFLPEEAWKNKLHRACIPGLVLVQAQILTILEITIYRQSHSVHAEAAIDDFDGPDSAAPIPITLVNAARSVGENRLIMLFRDLLADRNPDRHALREFYIKSFDDVIKSATRKISMYNNDACFVLCDFMEEVLAIRSRYHKGHNETPILDWPFWSNVCRVMMSSHNSLTQIRLIAFLYSMWNILISNDDRRRQLCLEWLLEPDIFENAFHHWSPMVRHYFMRLLCWRLARHDGDTSPLDIEIFQALADRLNSSWASYLYLRAEAEMLDKVIPSSAPCTPAPSRTLIVIRTDSQPFQLSSFDSLVSPEGLNQATPYKRHSSLLSSVPEADSPSQSTKKRWSLFRGFLASPGNPRPGEVTPPPTKADEQPPLDTESLDSLSLHSFEDRGNPRPVSPAHQVFSFKFSLEWLDRPAGPSRNRKLSPPMLPAGAQVALLMAKGEPAEVNPKKPLLQHLASAKYAGRALAEWSQVVAENEYFFQRRKDEGVPNNRLVETPTLGVESFRMIG